MDDAMKRAVERAITTMHENLGEQLTVDDLARTAMFSKFHFSRIFQQATGLSPGRFLSALRLQEAKRLLLETSLSVADISSQVGYASVGTFSTRFKSSVGVAPTQYREGRGYTRHIATDDRRDGWGQRSVDIHGEIIAAPAQGECGLVFIGLFREPIPQGAPVRCSVLERPGRYRLRNVPQGTWHVLALSAVTDDRAYGLCSQNGPLTVGAHGPLAVAPDSTAALSADVRLRKMELTDPPVLLALLDVRAAELQPTGT